MEPASARAVRFVRALIGGGVAVWAGDTFAAVASDGRRVTLERAAVDVLRSQGVLGGTGRRVTAGPGVRSWLRRAIIETDPHASQHRHLDRSEDGPLVNLNESPLGRLAMSGPNGAPPFLARHQVEAGERVRRLVERARLQPRVTMSYDPAHTARGVGSSSELGDLASDARRSLAEIDRLLPADCAGVVLDVCGFLKGLQIVEIERGWPRRSAKLVLRIGLDQLAAYFGFAPLAVGAPNTRNRTWLGAGARPTVVE